MTQTAAQWLLQAQDAAPMPLEMILQHASADPWMGALESPMQVLRIVESDAVQRVRLELSRTIQSFLQAVATAPDVNLSAEWRCSAMRMAVPAVLLGLPEAVDMIDRFPSTLHTPVDRDLLSPRFSADEPTFSLYGLAFAHSLLDTLDAIASMVLRHGDKPGVDLTLGWAHEHDKPFGRSFDVTGMMGHLGAVFFPSVLVRAVIHHRSMRTHGDADEMALAEMASSALVRDNTTAWHAFRPAFLSLGLYQHDPARSFQAACIHGHVDVLRSLAGKVPWDRLGIGADVAQSPTMGALARAQQPPAGIPASVYEDGLLEVARQAIVDGQQSMFFRKLACKTPFGVEVEPARTMLVLGFNRLLLKFLDHGWDPHSPLLPGTKTMVELAKDNGNVEAVSIMMSHGARRKLHSLLEDMGDNGILGFCIGPEKNPAR